MGGREGLLLTSWWASAEVQEIADAESGRPLHIGEGASSCKADISAGITLWRGVKLEHVGGVKLKC